MDNTVKRVTLHIKIAFIFLNMALAMSLCKEEAKSRQKRILWITEDGRLALPPGTTLVMTPSLSMPFVRYPPEGFFSNLTISLPFTIDFNKLGLTDNENPYGVVPPLLARSMGRAAGNVLADYIGGLLARRSTRSVPPTPLKEKRVPHPDAFHGGERAVLYVALEDMLDNFGMNGRACLLRAICEVHANKVEKFGLIGEVLKLFLSASKSPYADILNEYVEAENLGSGKNGASRECWPYVRDCPKSLFLPRHNPYSETEENNISDEQDDANPKVTYGQTFNM
ncbi:unnamed protein product [Acanthoscelides obtectus]|uniref:Uncharacterized protein n=1 Tax=Acanthoscelides obtectus TaxID=200917 RepID=A0A9P0PF53_ACAOB|nr:unnamed protein product [Acanthoscelides obtectus]CAK1682071.1 hypothetical protein AOBTE_LOCUS33411 [Acanthoscelides obtectus]